MGGARAISPPAKIPTARPRARALRLRAAACRPSGLGRRSGPIAMSNALHGRWASRRSLVFPSRLAPQCHGWRRSSRHMCSLCSSCAPLAEGRHHTRWPSTTAQHRPAPPRRARPTRAAPIAGGEVELALPSAEGQGARGRPNARPELQPITGGGEELSGRTWVQAAPPHLRAPAPRGAQRSTSRRAPALALLCAPRGRARFRVRARRVARVVHAETARAPPPPALSLKL